MVLGHTFINHTAQMRRPNWKKGLIASILSNFADQQERESTHQKIPRASWFLWHQNRFTYVVDFLEFINIRMFDINI